MIMQSADVLWSSPVVKQQQLVLSVFVFYVCVCEKELQPQLLGSLSAFL